MTESGSATVAVAEPARVGDDADPVEAARKMIAEAERVTLNAAWKEIEAILEKYGVRLDARLTSKDGGLTVFGRVVLVTS